MIMQPTGVKCEKLAHSAATGSTTVYEYRTLTLNKPLSNYKLINVCCDTAAATTVVVEAFKEADAVINPTNSIRLEYVDDMTISVHIRKADYIKIYGIR